MDGFSAIGNTASIVGLCVSAYAWWRVRAVRKAFQIEIGMNRLREKLSKEETELGRLQQAQGSGRADFAIGRGRLALGRASAHATALGALLPDEHRARLLGPTTRLARLVDVRQFEFRHLSEALQQTTELLAALENVMETWRRS